MRRRAGFTLIELLIVVAIIAILAAIAVPNFLNAQVRSKVSRVQADFRTVSLACNMYRVDTNRWPPDNFPGQQFNMQSFVPLTTPIAYITSVPQSPFIERSFFDNPRDRAFFEYWLGYVNGGQQIFDPGAEATGIWFRITSAGPDGESDFGSTYQNWPALIAARDPLFINGLYDATNGTVSGGDLVISNRGQEG